MGDEDPGGTPEEDAVSSPEHPEARRSLLPPTGRPVEGQGTPGGAGPPASTCVRLDVLPEEQEEGGGAVEQQPWRPLLEPSTLRGRWDVSALRTRGR